MNFQMRTFQGEMDLFIQPILMVAQRLKIKLEKINFK